MKLKAKDLGLKPVYMDRRPKRDRYLKTKLSGKLKAQNLGMIEAPRPREITR